MFLKRSAGMVCQQGILILNEIVQGRLCRNRVMLSDKEIKVGKATY